jgi:hypothetical protein
MAQRATLAATSRICKFNIGTELRMAFGFANCATQKGHNLELDCPGAMTFWRDTVITS